MVKGSLILQSSHSMCFQQYVVMLVYDFLVLLEFSHSRKHSTWIVFMVPEHMQGEIS